MSTATASLPTSHSDTALVDSAPSMSRPNASTKRRQSTPARLSTASRQDSCYPMPHSLQYETMDLQSTSPTETLASIRLFVLSYLADLEARISQMDTPWKGKGEMTVEELRQWSHTTLEMLEHIRDDVRAHLPDFPSIGNVSDVEDFVKSHLPDMRTRIDDFSSHLPDMPHLPDFPSVPDFRAKLDEVCATFQNIDIPHPLSYVPQLSEHLQNLHSHLSSMEMPTSPFEASSALISDMLDSLMSSDLVQEILKANLEVEEEVEEHILNAAAQQAVHIARGVKRSFEGSKLITLTDLPHAWRNNPFVRQGYRFIPIDKWPLILLSIFALHNETLNIHTHLIPFLTWGFRSIPFLNYSLYDTPEQIFMVFALLCLGTSAIWHVMAGCAHVSSMEFCARLDYVGIGWLISASVGTVVYYGYQCHPSIGNSFLLLCLTTGIAGSICPFMRWFNEYEYRNYRIAFFLALAFSALGPLAGMAYLYSFQEMWSFISPVSPSIISYLCGLFFYATHAPECFLSESWARKLDYVGGGSHCIWHCFIVLAVSQHKAAIASLKAGIGACTV